VTPAARLALTVYVTPVVWGVSSVIGVGLVGVLVWRRVTGTNNNEETTA
jgi:hypothetical protein